MKHPLIIDVRMPREFEYQHVEGAVNVQGSDWNGIRATIGEDRTKEVWLYCNTGRQSIIVKNMLEDCGYTNVRNCGTIAWTQFALNYYIQHQGEKNV